MDVSVIIVNWNTRALLLACLNSIREKTKTVAYEVIVVDNGSTDGSVWAVQEQFPEATVITLPVNEGFARANNIGIRASRGKYVLLLNSDTYLRNDALGMMFDFFEKHPDTGLLGGKVLNADGSLQPSCLEFQEQKQYKTDDEYKK